MTALQRQANRSHSQKRAGAARHAQPYVLRQTGRALGRTLCLLMYRKDKGYRIGIAVGARSDGRQEEPINGLAQRTNQEHADKVWILRVCGTREEACLLRAVLRLRIRHPDDDLSHYGADNGLLSGETSTGSVSEDRYSVPGCAAHGATWGYTRRTLTTGRRGSPTIITRTECSCT